MTAPPLSPLKSSIAGPVSPRSDALVEEYLRASDDEDLRTFEIAVALAPGFPVEFVSIAMLRALLGDEVDQVEQLAPEQSINLTRDGRAGLIFRRRPDIDPELWRRVGAFSTFLEWTNKAPARLDPSYACVDTKGRRCRRGSDFERARNEDAFPVTYYRAVVPF